MLQKLFNDLQNLRFNSLPEKTKITNEISPNSIKINLQLTFVEKKQTNKFNYLSIKGILIDFFFIIMLNNYNF